MSISSRDELIDYSYKRLGAPVLQINVERSQAEDRLDDALQLFVERHFDGVEKAYFKHQITETDKENRYVSTNDLGPVNGVTGDAPTGRDIISVIKLFQFGQFANINMFDVRYQMALSDYFGINRGLNSAGSLGLASYDVTKQYIGLIEDFFQPEKRIRFNKVSNRIHIDASWDTDISVGKYIVIEAYVSLNPQIFTEIYNDRLLKEYFTALIKLQWGQNMSKFSGVKLPGGISMRGPELVVEAQRELTEIYQRFQKEYELPVDFMLG